MEAARPRARARAAAREGTKARWSYALTLECAVSQGGQSRANHCLSHFALTLTLTLTLVLTLAPINTSAPFGNQFPPRPPHPTPACVDVPSGAHVALKTGARHGLCELARRLRPMS